MKRRTTRRPAAVVDRDRKRAEAEIAAVDAALRAGHPAVQPPGSNRRRSAVRAAADALGVAAVALTARVGTPSRPGMWGRRYGLVPDWSLDSPEVPPSPALVAERRREVALEGEVARLRAELKAAYRAADDADAIQRVVGTMAQGAADPPGWLVAPAGAGRKTPEVPVTIWSDWHVGEVVDPAEVNGANAYDLATAERRVRRLVEATVNICLHHGPRAYPGIVVNLLGDFVSGAIHPELAKTDEEEVIPAALRARDLLVWALGVMADTFGHVYVPCAAGNHGRNTVKPEFKRIVQNSFDWLIYQLLRRHFEGDARIRIDVPASNEVLYRVHGLRFLAMHGDMLGVKGGDGIIGAIGPIMRGEIKTARQSAVIGRDYDVLLIGHWHFQLWLQRAIVANTLKGFCQYAAKALRAVPTPPSQPLFFVHPGRGITSRWEVYVDETRSPPSPWVSFPAAGAASGGEGGRRGKGAGG